MQQFATKHKFPVRFNVASRSPRERKLSEPFHQWLSPQGQPLLQFHRFNRGYWLSFPGLADFQVSAGGRSVRCWPARGTTRGTLEHLYLNQVLPLALSRQGQLVLHASAIDIDGAGVAFLGSTGKGKSTLAAGFATNGHRFMTDDGLLVEHADGDWWIRPSHPSIRLWDDSFQALIPARSPKAPAVQYTSKTRVLAGRGVPFCADLRPLRRLYFLGDGRAKKPTIRPVHGPQAVIELVKTSFVLDVEQKDLMKKHFSELTDLVSRSVCFHLDYPRTYEDLPRVRQAIIEHTRETSVEAAVSHA